MHSALKMEECVGTRGWSPNNTSKDKINPFYFYLFSSRLILVFEANGVISQNCALFLGF